MESASMSRRRFLRGRLRDLTPVPRPPWALAESHFIGRCTRCDACIASCPTAVLVRADGGYPAVDFSRGECAFCGDCVSRCEPGALQRTDERGEPWALRAQIGDDCLAMHAIECRVCGENCPTGAIRFRPRAGGVALPELTLAACTGCGACFAPCPARAIRIQAATSPFLEIER